MTESPSLGLILLKAGVVTPRDLIEAHGTRHGAPLWKRLVALGMATEEQIQRAVAAHVQRQSHPRSEIHARIRPSLRPAVRPVLRKYTRLH
jgi:hypothetical protein